MIILALGLMGVAAGQDGGASRKLGLMSHGSF